MPCTSGRPRVAIWYTSWQLEASEVLGVRVACHHTSLAERFVDVKVPSFFHTVSCKMVFCFQGSVARSWCANVPEDLKQPALHAQDSVAVELKWVFPPQNSRILLIGTPKKGTPMFGNPQVSRNHATGVDMAHTLGCSRLDSQLLKGIIMRATVIKIISPVFWILVGSYSHPYEGLLV